MYTPFLVPIYTIHTHTYTHYTSMYHIYTPYTPYALLFVHALIFVHAQFSGNALIFALSRLKGPVYITGTSDEVCDQL